MPSTRERGSVAVAPTSAATAAASSRTRTRTPAGTTSRKATAAAVADDAGLADELERVLQISQTKTAGPSRRSANPTAAAESSKKASAKAAGPPVRVVKTVTKASSSANLRAGPSGTREAARPSSTVPTASRTKPIPATDDAPPRRAQVSAQAGPSRLGGTTSARPSTTARPRSPSSTAPKRARRSRPSPPWASDTTLSPSQRAHAALSHVSAAQNGLALATRAGYRAGRPVEGDAGSWTEEKVADLVEDSEMGIRALREIHDRGQLGRRGTEVERASVGLVQRCLGVMMYDTALNILTGSRERLIRLYAPDHVESSTQGQAGPVNGLPAEWLALLQMPPLPQDRTLDEPIRTVLFQATMSAWIAVVAVKARYKARISQHMTSPAPHPNTSNMLHPLDLAINLPRSTTSPLLNLFIRLASSISTSSSDWSTIIRVSYIARSLLLSPTTSSSDAKAEAPGELWASIHGKLVSWLKEWGGETREVAAVLQDVVGWVEGMVDARNEARGGWFAGKAWMGLMDLWISLGRKIGDSAMIDDALARMTGSTTITSHPAFQTDDQPGPSTPRSSTPLVPPARPVPSRSGSSRRAVIRVSDAELDVTRHCGEMASLGVVLDKFASAPEDDIALAAAQSALDSSSLDGFADALCSLADTASAKTAFHKAVRVLEQTRRRCGQLLNTCSKGAADKTGGLEAALHAWLVGYVDLAEDFVQITPIDLSGEADNVRRLSCGAIDTLLTLFDLSLPSPSDPQSPLAYLHRIHRLTLLCRPLIPADVHVDWVRCCSARAYARAGELKKADKYADAMPYLRMSVDRVTELLHYMEGVEGVERDKSRVGEVEKVLSGRWEMLGHIAGKLQDQQTVFEANAAALSTVPASVLLKLVGASKTLQYRKLWDSLPDLEGLLHRIAFPLLNDPGRSPVYVDLLLSTSSGPGISDVDSQMAKALMMEKLFEGLEKGLYLPEVVQGAMKVADWVMGAYEADAVPVRRTRFLCRVLGTMLQTETRAEQAPGVLLELDRLSGLKDLGQDEGLRSSVPEYRATSLLLRALFAYRQGTNSVSEVSTAAAQAMHELRQIILPPTATATKTAAPSVPPVIQPKTTRTKQPLGRASTTPAPRTTTSRTRTVSASMDKTPKRTTITSTRKASENSPRSLPAHTIPPSPTAIVEFADLPRLLSLLSSLISLLGLLALPLQKIEALKLARALMRSRDDMVGEYTTLSARLGTEYARLGKWGRASAVFGQAKRGMDGVTEERRAEWGLRWAGVLAQMGRVEEARKEYEDAYALHLGLTPAKTSTRAMMAIMDRAGKYERAALARIAFAAVLSAEGKSALVVSHLASAYRLYERYVEFIAKLGPESASAPPREAKIDDDPFSAPSTSRPAAKSNGHTGGMGANQPAKDSIQPVPPIVAVLDNRVLSGIQWHATEALLGATFDLASAYALRGVARDIEYFLEHAKTLAGIVKSPLLVARAEARIGELEGRMRKYETSAGRMEAAQALFVNSDGPDAVEGRVIQGDLLEKQEAAHEALAVFQKGGEDIEGLEEGFGKKEALLPTPERPAAAARAISTLRAQDRLLPSTLAHVLRQRLWLGRKEGMEEVEKAELVKQIQALDPSITNKAEEMYLHGRLALLEVLKVFKTDLFMSSLTDSTIAMPMSTLTRRTQDRHSTRRTVNTLLAKSAAAFQSALELMDQDGQVEDVRGASMSLALLHAFQTSLGEGGEGLTRAAADLLASTASITMRREMVDIIEAKFIDGPLDDLKWPSLPPQAAAADNESDSDADEAIRSAWTTISNRLQSPRLASSPPVDLSSLPHNWAVVSISVASDHSTMFLSRHQRDHPPLVLCLPLDRTGERESEENELPFQAALDELQEIVRESDDQAQAAKHISDSEAKQEWWAFRTALDERMGELLASMEKNWLGSFKSILKPQSSVTPNRIQVLRRKMEKIFNEALAGIGTDLRRVKTVRLDDAVLACFATLDGQTTDEEIEDLVYFVLDFYGFHGIPVAIAELDIDQIGVDVKQALHEIAISHSTPPTSAQPEHLLLVLDKNVQGFPWESIPVLRGLPVSRIPSLPFLLDHLEFARLTSPEKAGLLSVNARKVFYVLNPSGDLARTQTHFEPWLEQMKARAGWKGIVGRPPTDMELANALRDCDLVLYFGHGGAEQYIRSKKVRVLPKCATTMLWGCSSGHLKDQGDLDRTGTAWTYMMAGCLIANLWDVTDRDIDRLSTEVHKKLGLDASHLGSSSSSTGLSTASSSFSLAPRRLGGKSAPSEPALLPLSGLSTVQALNSSRDDCRLKYLTGAAPVVYGLPVYMF